MSDLKKLRERAEYYKRIDADYLDGVNVAEYIALIECAEALQRAQVDRCDGACMECGREIQIHKEDCFIGKALAKLERAP